MTKKDKQILNPDFCVIGAGSGGLSFAAGAVQMGASVVLLESKKMGGDCLNYGCVPSKALIAAAKFGHESLRSKDFGWADSKSKVDFEKVHEHIHNVIKAIAPNDSAQRFEKLGAHVILEQGHFIDDKTVETESHRIKAKRFIIATGSTPFVPPIEGLSTVPYLTNETIFDSKELPKHLVVIGGGPIGIEMAQAFLRLGSKVTVLEAFSALPKDDPEITLRLKEILISEGIDLNENVKISSIKQVEQEIHIECQTSYGQQKTLKASHIIVATGRRPNIQNLNLELAGVKFSPRGIEVNAHLQTSNPKVYAIGDCTGGYQFTHVAGYHAGLAIRNSIFGLKTKVETRAIPWVTYTDPELAHVGFMESQLQEKQIDLLTPIFGSGPAYFFLLADILLKEAMKHGISAEDAKKMIDALVIGSARLINEKQSYTELISSICSKKGVTEVALKHMKPRLVPLIEQGLNAALNRIDELKNENSN
jgi:pyruvate/2-oxoglutarate dehydrogenase complex dihydrolipoamide dehydrogenase (E3) component